MVPFLNLGFPLRGSATPKGPEQDETLTITMYIYSALGFSGYFSFILHINLVIPLKWVPEAQEELHERPRVCWHQHHCKRQYLDPGEAGWSPRTCNDPFFPSSPQPVVPFIFVRNTSFFVPLPPTRKYITDTDTIHLFIRKQMNMCQMGWGDYSMFPAPMVTQWGWYENLSYSWSQLPQQNYESQFPGRKITFQQNLEWGAVPWMDYSKGH